MGEAIRGLPEAPEVAHGGDRAAAEPAEPVGPWLARQRQLRGIELSELARITHIPIRSLERLESGALDGRPDGFTRGFVRTVAIAIGLDPEDAVARLLPEATPRRGLPVASLRRWLAAFSVLAVVLTVGLLGFRLVTAWTPSEAVSPDQMPRLRRDPVRELAEAQGLLPARNASTAQAASGIPTPVAPGGGHPEAEELPRGPSASP